MSEQHVKGLKELNKFLQELPVKIERNIMRGALRTGATLIKAQAASNVPNSPFGKLALFNSLKLGTRSKGGTVTAYVKSDLFYAKFVEFGTKAHNIAAKKGGWLSFMNVFTKSVAHPGARPHPFLRPALDSQATNAVNAAAAYMRDRLATKHGLDTSGIVLDGDE